MGMFNSKGKLNIPLQGEIDLPEDKVSSTDDGLVIKEAYCQNGHSLVSDVLINNSKGIQFICTNQDGTQENTVVVSSIVGDKTKVILKGEPFEGQIPVKVLCPTCRAELPILFDCECGAPIYLFYIDSRLNHNYAQSFCSRIGCKKASQLRFSQDVMRDFIHNYRF